MASSDGADRPVDFAVQAAGVRWPTCEKRVSSRWPSALDRRQVADPGGRLEAVGQAEGLVQVGARGAAAGLLHLGQDGTDAFQVLLVLDLESARAAGRGCRSNLVSPHRLLQLLAEAR